MKALKKLIKAIYYELTMLASAIPNQYKSDKMTNAKKPEYLIK